MSEQGHSEKFFKEERDYWYNSDFFELMAKRWKLSQYQTLLDVGCGQCHWSRLLVPYLQSPAVVTAADADKKWAAGNKEISDIFASQGASVHFCQADAHRLPFNDNTFDVVTCQTVLIHVKDPQMALLEMKRVVKPGGIVICSEPNNRIQALVQTSMNLDESIAGIIENVKYTLAYEYGKIKSGEGNNWYGDLLAGAFNDAGLVNIQSYLNDKTIPLYPPYSNAEQQAVIDTWKSLESEGLNNHGAHEQDYFNAMGSEYAAFFKHYNSKTSNQNFMDILHANKFSRGGASVMYLVSGEK